jgi:hypothetical protein
MSIVFAQLTEGPWAPVLVHFCYRILVADAGDSDVVSLVSGCVSFSVASFLLRPSGCFSFSFSFSAGREHGSIRSGRVGGISGVAGGG